MFETKLILFYVALVLAIGFIVVQLYFHSKFKRDSQLSEFDQSLFNFKLVSIFCVVMLFVFAAFSPITGDYSKIRLENSTQEEVLQQFVENQQEISYDIVQQGRINFLLFILAGCYFASLINFLGKLQIDRQITNSKLKKPLGL